MRKIKKGDTVIVNTGVNAGKTGDIIEVITKTIGETEKIFVKVSGINRSRKRIVDANNRNKKSYTVCEKPIDASNVDLYDRDSGKKIKVGFVHLIANRKKVRYIKGTSNLLGKV